MAADGVDSLRVQVSHGSEKYDVQVDLPALEAGRVLTLSHLSRAIAKLTEVPINHQKLICKGKALTDQFASLKSLGIKNNSKIMLIGKKFSPGEDANMVTMDKVDSEFSKVELTLDEIKQEFDGIKNGYLPADLAPEALKKLGLQVGVCAEQLTRQLERLDGLTLAEASQDVRQRRKGLVTKIQAFLDRCDNLKADIREEKSRR